MDNETYMFSWYTKVMAPMAKQVKFLYIFKRVEIQMTEQWQRRVISGLTKAEADILMELNLSETLPNLLRKFMGKDAFNVQLEVELGGSNPSEYVKTQSL